MVAKQVLSRLTPSRKNKKSETGFQHISLEVCTCKDLVPASNPPEETPLSGYYYPWSPSSLDLLFKNESSKISPSSSRGSSSPTLSLNLPDSSFGSLFSVPRRKPVPSDSPSPTQPSTPENEFQPSPLSLKGRGKTVLGGPLSPPSNLTSNCANPDAFDWPYMICELDSRPRSIAELAVNSNRASLASLDLHISHSNIILQELSADAEISSSSIPSSPPPPYVEATQNCAPLPLPLPQSEPVTVTRPPPPSNKPSFRHFCYRNRLMQYSPVAQNPFLWSADQEQPTAIAVC